MNTRISKLFLALFLVGVAMLVSCSREEPVLAPVFVPVVLDIKMNEIYSRGVAGNLDWIELYNPSNVAVNISGYKIYDIGATSTTTPKPKKEIPAGTMIPANGFYVVIPDTNSSATVLDGFGLSSAGEQVWLEKADGTLIDNIAFLAMDVSQTYGRYPDGGSTWQLLGTITRGAANKP
jgi:hypothetical protein